MKETTSEDRIFGTLSIVLLSISLLVPWIIEAFSKIESAIGFGIVGLLLAFVFGIIGWNHRAGKVTAYIIGVLFALSFILSLARFF